MNKEQSRKMYFTEATKLVCYKATYLVVIKKCLN